VHPSLKDWLNCPNTSSHRQFGTPMVAIEVIFVKTLSYIALMLHNMLVCCTIFFPMFHSPPTSYVSVSFPTCCIICIQLLQCNFSHVCIPPTSYV
jgi:hypothetical protein